MALTDEETLYNAALDRLGEYRVTEGQTSTKQYLACQRNYAKARDEAVIEVCPTEATTRAILKNYGTDPLHTYDYAYAIPLNCLRILEIGTNYYNWREEEGYIRTNVGNDPAEWLTTIDYVAGQYVNHEDSTYLCATTHTSDDFDTDLAAGYWTDQGDEYKIINVTYIKQITLISSFSKHLYEAIALKLAIKIASFIVNNPEKIRMNLINEYEKLCLPRTRFISSSKGTPRMSFQSNWIRSRLT